MLAPSSTSCDTPLAFDRHSMRANSMAPSRRIIRPIIMSLTIMLLWVISLDAAAKNVPRLRLATTTSVDNSGLISALNHVFEKQHDIKVDVIAVGSGKAIKLAKNGDVDLIVVHSPNEEKPLIASKGGIRRASFMYNDFVLVGPGNDPAKISSALTAAEAMQKIANSQSTFISRGDNSGTHTRELALWENTGTPPDGRWYLSAGQGMGAVLMMASDKNGYTLSDRGTYLAYEKKISSRVLYPQTAATQPLLASDGTVTVATGDSALLNIYSVILVNPEKHPHVKKESANQYRAFLLGSSGQRLIDAYQINKHKLFFAWSKAEK